MIDETGNPFAAGKSDISCSWPSFFHRLHACLQTIAVTGGNGNSLATPQGFALLETACGKVKERSGQVFFVGNGASASMCSHFATDLGKNAHFRTQVFSDAALLTAFANDICFERVFAEPLRRNARTGDMLVAVSSSGNSPNIVETVRTARAIGVWVVTLTGMSPANAVRAMGDLNFWVDAETYGMVETAHAAILHYWLDCMVARYGDAE